MDRENKKKLIIKVCCVIAAIVLRFYVSNVENPIIRYEIKNVPVIIRNDEKLIKSGLILKEDGENNTVNLTIKGPTNQVKKLSRIDFKVTADLEALALKEGKNRILVTVEDYPDGVNVIENQQMLITIDLDKYIEREFRIEVSFKGTTKEGYYEHEAVLVPEVIKIAGGSETLDKIDKVIVEVDRDGASNDINKEVDVIINDASAEPIEGLNLYPSKIKVIVPINRKKSVPVEVKLTGNLPENLKLKSMQNDTPTVKVSGDEADLKILEKIETMPLDLSKITGSKAINIDLKVPKGITVIGETKTVRVRLEIERIIEKNIINVIKEENLEEGYEANLQINTMNITVKGIESIINKIDYRNIDCFVDLNTFKEGTHIANVQVKAPEGVEVIEQDIETVKVEIIKKEEVENTEDSADNQVDGETGNQANENSNNQQEGQENVDKEKKEKETVDSFNNQP